MTRLPILDYICLSPCRETPTIRHQSRLYMEKKSSRNHQPVYHTMLCECSHLAIELSTLVNLIRSLSIWAVFKIPLSFHSTGCFIGIPLLDYYNPQFLLRIFIPQLIINPARGGSQNSCSSQATRPFLRQPVGRDQQIQPPSLSPSALKYWLRVWSMIFLGALYRGMFVLGGVWNYHVFHP